MSVSTQENRIVIGAGATGKTALLDTWSKEKTTLQKHLWLKGNSNRFLKAETIEQALATEPELLLLDDLQWFDETALERIATLLATPSVALPCIWASRRPWPSTPTLSFIEESIEHKTALGPFSFDELGTFVAKISGKAIKTDQLQWYYGQTSGSPGLCADIFTAGWGEDRTTEPSEKLFSLVGQRFRKTTAEAYELAATMALATIELDEALARLSKTTDTEVAEQSLRSSGMLDGQKKLITVAEKTLLHNLSSNEKESIFTTLAASEKNLHTATAKKFALAGSSTKETAPLLISMATASWFQDPLTARTLLQKAQQAAVLTPQAQRIKDHIDFRHDNISANKALVEELLFAQSINDLRWEQAARQTSRFADAATATAMVQLLNGQFEGTTTQTNSDTVSANILHGLQFCAQGDSVEALRSLTNANTKQVRQGYNPDLTDSEAVLDPRFWGTLAALSLGDTVAAQSILEQVLRREDSRSKRSYLLLSGYLQLTAGEYKKCLELTQSQTMETLPTTDWSLNDQLLWAAVNAGLALRSGNIEKLKQAWKSADYLLLQVSPSWIYLEIFQDLLVAGARLGDMQRVGPLAAELEDQCNSAHNENLAADACWLSLHLAIASNQPSLLRSQGEKFKDIRPHGQRASLRQRAAHFWVEIERCKENPNHLIDEEALVDVSNAFCKNGDPWQASRLLGQAALEISDPKAARRLLEKARNTVVEVNQSDNGLLSTTDLSDRETEVASGIAAGKTYKQIGEQLFISPKTVEHHAAKIRQKLGAKNRTEMLDMLRELS